MPSESASLTLTNLNMSALAKLITPLISCKSCVSSTSVLLLIIPVALFTKARTSMPVTLAGAPVIAAAFVPVPATLIGCCHTALSLFAKIQSLTLANVSPAAVSESEPAPAPSVLNVNLLCV